MADVGAMEELGRRLMSGSGVPRDTSSGAGWFRRAADANHRGATRALAMLYLTSAGVPRDQEESARTAARLTSGAAAHGTYLGQIRSFRPPIVHVGPRRRPFSWISQLFLRGLSRGVR